MIAGKFFLAHFSFAILFVSELVAVDYLAVGDGKAITVVNSATASTEYRKAQKEGRKVHGFDRMTGILVAESTSAESCELNLDGLPPITTPLFNNDGEKIALVVGIQRKSNDKIPPFGYIRVAYYIDKIPSGTFLFDAEKKLVAVLYNTDKDDTKQGYASPIKAALRGYEDYNKNGIISRAWVGLTVSGSNSVPEIVHIRPDSPASKIGMKNGDILLKIGDSNISNYLEAVNAFYYLLPGKEEEFVVLRGTEKKILKVRPVAHPSTFAQ